MVSQNRHQSDMSRRGEQVRLAPALLELFPERVMLSSRELSDVVKLEASGVLTPQLLTWAQEICTQRQGAKISHVLQQLHQRVKRWKASHIGDKYAQEHESYLSQSQLAQATEELIAKLQRAEAELHEPKLRLVLEWVTHQVIEVTQQALSSSPSFEPLNLEQLFEQLSILDHELHERVSLALPIDLQRRVQRRVQELLEREMNRSRPQDFIVAQRAVYRTLLASELGLPNIRLSLFDQW